MYALLLRFFLKKWDTYFFFKILVPSTGRRVNLFVVKRFFPKRFTAFFAAATVHLDGRLLTANKKIIARQIRAIDIRVARYAGDGAFSYRHFLIGID